MWQLTEAVSSSEGLSALKESYFCRLNGSFTSRLPLERQSVDIKILLCMHVHAWTYLSLSYKIPFLDELLFANRNISGVVSHVYLQHAGLKRTLVVKVSLLLVPIPYNMHYIYRMFKKTCSDELLHSAVFKMTFRPKQKLFCYGTLQGAYFECSSLCENGPLPCMGRHK